MSAYDTSSLGNTSETGSTLPTTNTTTTGTNNTGTNNTGTNNTGTNNTGTSTVGDAPEISSIAPDYGTTAGGDLVTITGAEFDASAEVLFNGSAGNLITVSDTEMTVRTPAAAEGLANITVTTDAGSRTLNSAFTYWQDGTGLFGITGIAYWFDYVGNYWSDPQPVDYGYADFAFLVPETYPSGYEVYTPSLNTCRSNYTTTTVDLYAYTPGVSSADVTAPSGSAISLPTDSDGYLFTADLNASQFQTGNYGLKEMVSASWPSFTLSNLYRTPSAFSITAPNLNSISTVNRNSLQIRWTPAGTADYVSILIDNVNASNTVVETITCAVSDTGSFTVPSSVWTQWTSNHTLYFMIGSWKQSTGTIPFNNSNMDTYGAYLVYGAAVAM